MKSRNIKITSSFVVLIFLISLMMFDFASTVENEDPLSIDPVKESILSSSWLTDWSYRKSHTILGDSDAGTNYQVRINIHRSTGPDSENDVYLGTDCNADYSDIRFTQDDGVSPLDYWIEEDYTSSLAVVWVEIPDLTSTIIIYLYCGNSGATSESNGDATFLWFDDGSDSSYWVNDHTSGASVTSDGDVISVSSYGTGSSWHGFSTDPSDAYFALSEAQTTGCRTRAKIDIDSNGNNNRMGDFYFMVRATTESPATGTGSYYRWRDSWVGDQAQVYMRGHDYLSSRDKYSFSGTFEICEFENTEDDHWIYLNDVLEDSGDGDYDRSWAAVEFLFNQYSTYTVYDTMEMDWMFTSKFCSPEPIHSIWGDRESAPDNPLDWNYKKSHTVSLTNAPDDFQTKITVHYLTGDDDGEDVYLNGHCQEDFDDIRFMDQNGVTFLSHWRESFVEQDNAVFWIEIPTWVNDEYTFYIYYGNGQVSSASNGDATFLLFDDFDGVAGTYPDATTWNHNPGVDGVALDGQGNLKLEDEASGERGSISSLNSFGPWNLAIHSRTYCSSGQIRNAYWGSLSNGEGDAISWYANAWNNGIRFNTYDAESVPNRKYTDDEVSPLDSWRVYETEWTDGNAKWKQDGYTWFDHDQCVPDEASSVFLAEGTGGYGAYALVDWVFVRKISTQPLVHDDWGVEETVNSIPNFSAWNIMKYHVIHSSEDAGTFYQVRFTAYCTDGIDWDDEVYLSGCRNSFNDVRFTTDDGKVELDYWREDSVPGSHAIFWVELADSLHSDVMIRVYYDGTDTAVDSGEDVFILFDDFTGTVGASPDSSKWYEQTNGDGVKLDGSGHLKLQGTSGSRDHIRSHEKYGPMNLALHSIYYVHQNGDRNTHLGDVSAAKPTENDAISLYTNSHGDGIRFNTYNDGVRTYSDYDMDDMQQYKEYVLEWLPNEANYYQNGIRQFHHTSNIPDEGGHIYFTEGTISTSYALIDQVFLRKCVSTEPEHGMWGVVFIYEDCQGISSQWEESSRYNSSMRYPMEEPRTGDWNSYLDGQDYYLQGWATSSASYLQGRSQWIDTASTEWFKIKNLGLFKVRLGCQPGSNYQRGLLHVTLHDDWQKPMIDIQLIDTSSSSNEVSINVVYYDENLMHDDGVDYPDPISSKWKGEFSMWYVEGEGIRLDFGIENEESIVLAGTNRVNPERKISMVSTQFTSYSAGISNIPDYRIYSLQVYKTTTDPGLDINRARELRSGPDDMILHRPSPATEIQFLSTSPLKFIFYQPYFLPTSMTFTFDIAAIAEYDIQGTIDVEISVSDPWNTHTETIQVSDDPQLVDNSYKFLHSFNVICGFGYCRIEIKLVNPVSNDIEVALRGVWVNSGSIQVDPVFTSSDTLNYYVPMGPDTLMDLQVLGFGTVNVFVDGIQKTEKDVNNWYILGDFCRNTLHKLTLTFTGTGECVIDTMHVSHHYMTAEVDYFEGGEPTTAELDYLVNYYKSFTHGRIEYELASTAIPLSYNNLYTGDSPYSIHDLATLAHDYSFYEHLDKRDVGISYFWVVYKPDGVGGGSTFISNDYKGSISSTTLKKNGWTLMFGIVGALDSAQDGVMMHEWGHMAGFNYDNDPVNYPDLECDEDNCAFGPVSWFDNNHYCYKHWYETWYNREDWYADPQREGCPWKVDWSLTVCLPIHVIPKW